MVKREIGKCNITMIPTAACLLEMDAVVIIFNIIFMYKDLH